MADQAAQARAHEIFDPIAADYLAREAVDIGAMFGSEGMRIRGKIFALVDHDGGLMLKIPRMRAEQLVEGGLAERVSMAGRTTREWLTVSTDRGDLWEGLIGEAHAYVDAITP